MLLKKRIFIVLVLLGIIAMTCYVVWSNKDSKYDKEEKAKKDYILKLTDDEINGDHIKLDLNKNVTVDADITHISEYKNGLNFYYIKHVGKTNNITYKEFKKLPMVFDSPIKDLTGLIEDNSKGKFSTDKINIDDPYNNYYSYTVDFINKDNKKGEFKCHVETDDNHKIISEQVDFTACTVDWDKDGATSDSVSKITVGTTLLENKNGFDEPELSFGSKSDIAGKLSELIKDITKSDNYGDYQCVVVNDKTFSSAFEYESLSGYIEELKPLDAECYVYFFPYKIDGFEWISSEWLKHFKVLRETVGIEFADDVAYSDIELLPLNAHEQKIAFNENGIAEMDLYESVEVEGIYKEKQEVLPINEIVNILQDYFNSKAPFKRKVYNIKLCYTGMFSDVNDGALRNIAKPCWSVEYTEDRNKFDIRERLFIDASTGDVYE